MSGNLRARICGPALVTYLPAYIDQINSELRMNWLYPLAPL
jgi:hypothetical protein